MVAPILSPAMISRTAIFSVRVQAWFVLDCFCFNAPPRNQVQRLERIGCRRLFWWRTASSPIPQKHTWWV